MHAEYVDIPYSWNNDFEDDDKIHVLVMGDSYGRDFANILNESSISDSIEISYKFGSDTSLIKDRIAQADFVFYGSSSWTIPKSLSDGIDDEKLYIVGNKEFGKSNGIIYKNKNKDWYFDQAALLSDEFLLQNNALRGIYADHYIDMIQPLLVQYNQIRVFTDDGYFISQDCRHLTKHGAQYYAKLLNFDFINK